MQSAIVTMVLATCLLFHPRQVAADGERVKQSQPLSEILGLPAPESEKAGEPEKAKSGGLAAPDQPGHRKVASTPKTSVGRTLEVSKELLSPSIAGNRLLRVSLWAGGLGLSIFGAVVLFRRRMRGTTRLDGSEGIQVVGRTAISPRHAVVVLRVSNHRLVVGLSGERMTSLGILDDASAESTLREPGFSARPEDHEAVSQARTIKDSDLVPYRQQVDRLRGLLRGVRKDFAGEDPRGESKGSVS
jgi:flagellar biogenesis protein FliO